ncbi:dicarboxylate/amino acid:cation symporter [Sandaracinobacteroides sp. A072]|uniref:dicarboxylate/amino acid:cation symporter n=1 Tax=Sandaracinobacteroides sp. A072 TaxID=3461146 RepID=UPI004042F55F
MARKLTLWILFALVAGLVVGFVVNQRLDAEGARAVADGFSIITDVFLRLIKMIIAPLVLAALISGIGHMGGDVAALGRIGGRAIAWFLATSVGALFIGLFVVQWLEPGAGLNLPLPPVDASAGLETDKFTLKNFVTHLVPKSIFEALATNEILQIVVFSVFAGIALAAIGEKGKPLLHGAEALMALMLKVTQYVMIFAPPAVFAAVAATIAVQGLAVLKTYGLFMGGFYVSLLLLMAFNIIACAFVIGWRDALRLIVEVKDAFLLSFSTASSEAAYPRILEALERYGIPNRISSFVLPLGYSFNLDGSMMYCVFAVLFIAQAYGVEFTFIQQLGMMALLMVTSKGIAGVPRASLVVIAATLTFFDLPAGGLVLILAVDHFLDMGRSATNAIGNSIAAAVVSKWEMDREAREGDAPQTEIADAPR